MGQADLSYTFEAWCRPNSTCILHMIWHNVNEMIHELMQLNNKTIQMLLFFMGFFFKYSSRQAEISIIVQMIFFLKEILNLCQKLQSRWKINYSLLTKMTFVPLMLSLRSYKILWNFLFFCEEQINFSSKEAKIKWNIWCTSKTFYGKWVM